jgi:hypothetical protein
MNWKAHLNTTVAKEALNVKQVICKSLNTMMSPCLKPHRADIALDKGSKTGIVVVKSSTFLCRGEYGGIFPQNDH